jgi:hypothetical protein
MKSSIINQLEYTLKRLETAEAKADKWAKEYTDDGFLSVGNNYPFKYGVMRQEIISAISALKSILDQIEE